MNHYPQISALVTPDPNFKATITDQDFPDTWENLIINNTNYFHSFDSTNSKADLS